MREETVTKGIVSTNSISTCPNEQTSAETNLVGEMEVLKLLETLDLKDRVNACPAASTLQATQPEILSPNDGLDPFPSTNGKI